MTNKIAIVVDDDPFIRRYIKIMLKELGFVVHEACDRASAEKMAALMQFDLAILDGILPDGSGVALADKFDCQVIFVSGVTDQYNRQAMWQRGVLFQKPVDASFLQCVRGVYNGVHAN